MNFIDTIETMKFHQLMSLLSELNMEETKIVARKPFNSKHFWETKEKNNMVLSQIKILSFGIR